MKRVRLKKILWYASFIVTGLLIISFLLRNIVFSYYMDRRIQRFNDDYHARLKVEKARITKISTLEFTGITLKPEKGDTVLTIDTAYGTLDFWKMIFGRVVIRDLIMHKTWFNLVQVDSMKQTQ